MKLDQLEIELSDLGVVEVNGNANFFPEEVEAGGGYSTPAMKTVWVFDSICGDALIDIYSDETGRLEKTIEFSSLTQTQQDECNKKIEKML